MSQLSLQVIHLIDSETLLQWRSIYEASKESPVVIQGFFRILVAHMPGLVGSTTFLLVTVFRTDRGLGRMA